MHQTFGIDLIMAVINQNIAFILSGMSGENACRHDIQTGWIGDGYVFLNHSHYSFRCFGLFQDKKDPPVLLESADRLLRTFEPNSVYTTESADTVPGA